MVPPCFQSAHRAVGQVGRQGRKQVDFSQVGLTGVPSGKTIRESTQNSQIAFNIGYARLRR